VSDEIFDPEIHATDPKTGEPSLNKDGGFRKKRRDAGGARPAAPRAAKTPGGNGRAKHHAAVGNFLAIPVAGLGLVDPVMGFAAANLAPMWADALADLAVDNPRFAAMLEKAGGLGAAGAVVMVGVLTAVQFGHLMGKVPADMLRMMPGVQSREEIETILAQRGEQLARAAQARAGQASAPAHPADESRVMAHV
jgi:hypothetical protein